MNVITGSIVALENTDWEMVEFNAAALAFANRVFCIGNGGGAAHAMHFASDLRKIAGVPAYSFDNAAEMTARINDDGWERAWDGWLAGHRYDYLAGDRLFLFSVGGALDGLSTNLPWAALGIVGANGQDEASRRIVIPSTSTPVIEGCQAVIAHHLVQELCS